MLHPLAIVNVVVAFQGWYFIEKVPISMHKKVAQSGGLNRTAPTGRKGLLVFFD